MSQRTRNQPPTLGLDAFEISTGRMLRPSTGGVHHRWHSRKKEFVASGGL